MKDMVLTTALLICFFLKLCDALINGTQSVCIVMMNTFDKTHSLCAKIFFIHL